MNFHGLTSEVLFLFEHEGNIDVKASPIIIHVTRMLDCELIELNSVTNVVKSHSICLFTCVLASGRIAIDTAMLALKAQLAHYCTLEK